MVFGPIHPKLQTLDTINTSNQRIRDMMQGKAQDEVPPSGVHVWVDVRDLALAHVRAAERPEAAGKRFFVTAGYYSNRELADDLKEFLPDAKIGAKGGEFPDGTSTQPFVDDKFRWTHRRSSSGADDSAEYFKYDNSRSREVLGIDFRSLKDMVKDTIPTLQAVGA